MVIAIPSSTQVLLNETNPEALNAKVKLCPMVKAVTHHNNCFQCTRLSGKIRAAKNSI